MSWLQACKSFRIQENKQDFGLPCRRALVAYGSAAGLQALEITLGTWLIWKPYRASATRLSSFSRTRPLGTPTDKLGVFMEGYGGSLCGNTWTTLRHTDLEFRVLRLQLRAQGSTFRVERCSAGLSNWRVITRFRV